MQLLDDDMDELFRSAASQYPLKTDGADWDALSQRLQESSPKQTPVPDERADIRWYRWAILILLSFLLLVLSVPVLNVGNLPPKKGDSNTKAVKRADSKAVNSVDDSVAKGDINKVPVTQPATDNNKAEVTTTTPAVVDNNAAKAPETGVKNNTTAPTANKAPVAVANNNTTAPTANKAPVAVANNNTTAPTANKAPVTVANNNTNSPIANKAPVTVADNNVTTTPAVDQQPVSETANPFAIDLLQGLRYNYPAPDARLLAARLQPKDTPVAIKEKAAKTIVKWQKGVYVGVVVTPDISTVKFQSVNKAGYSAGIIAGYRISKRFSAETGLLWERKNYYTEGEYFNKKKVPATWGMKINDVSGYCNMFEIPVNVHYYFAMGQKSSWYATAGLSSYLMKKENYSFNFSSPGGYPDSKTWDYLNATRNWFSVINVGIGYERPIGLLGNLRVEPYVKLPAKGIGIGQLPLTSVGLNIGITKTIR